MQNNYIVRTKDDRLLSFFYTVDRGIYYKEYDGKWGFQKPVIEGVRECFTVNMAKNGDLYLFCQMISGDIVLCSLENGGWKNKVILKNKSSKVYDIIFYAIINDDSMDLLYNLKSENGSDFIIKQELDKHGHWKEAQRIDEAAALNGSIFQLQTIDSGGFIIFYQKRMPEINLGYKEFENSHCSEYNIFHKTSYRIVCSSFLAEKGRIHFLYAVKNLFSYQLIYRRRDAEGISNPTIVFESQGISECSMFITNGKLYVLWISGGQLYYSMAECGDDDFSRPAKYRKQNVESVVKAIYISPADNSNFICRELFLEAKRPSGIIFVPEVYADFYPLTAVAEQKKQEKQEAVINTYDRLKNQLSIYENQISTKDQQLLQLNNIIQSKNEEIVRIEANYIRKIKSMTEEVKRLKAQINELMEQTTYMEETTAEDGAADEV